METTAPFIDGNAPASLKRGECVTWEQTTQHRDRRSVKELTGELIGISPDGARGLAIVSNGFTYWQPIGQFRRFNPSLSPAK